MFKQSDEPTVLPYITNVTHTQEGLLIQFSHGATVFYQTSFLWDFRDYHGDMPVEIARGLAGLPQHFN